MLSLARLFPSTKVSEWVSGVITANSGYIDPSTGYWAGGASTSAVIDKTAFRDDATAALAATLSAGRRLLAGCANSGTAAYWGGEYISGAVDTIDKTTFSTDATAAITPTLSSARYALAGAANSATL